MVALFSQICFFVCFVTITRLRNGTGHIYGKVMLKGLVSIAAMRSMSGPISGAFSSAWDWIMWLFGDQTGIGYI